MKTSTTRKIVTIDEEKCNGCGACIVKCAEGALQIIDGKARLISDRYCDGLGACLGECPEGAITITERAAEEFSEAAVHEHRHAAESREETLPCGCPSATVTAFARDERPEIAARVARESELAHWPVQLTLVPPTAPFLKDADLLLAAQCVPFAYAGFHEDYLKDHALLIACPKLDDFPAHLAKLTQVLRQAQPRSVTVIRMEVPCCSGLTYMARQAIEAAGSDVPLDEVVISVRGQVAEEG